MFNIIRYIHCPYYKTDARKLANEHNKENYIYLEVKPNLTE